MFFRSVALFLCSGFVFVGSATAFPALTYSTYLRDNFTASAVAVDSAGNIYLAGNVIVDAATSQSTILIVKLNPQATEYLYTRFLGGSVGESVNAIAVDSTGNAYVAGVTNSPDFPVTGGSTLGTPPVIPSERSFVAKLDSKGELLFSTLLGGSTNSFAQAVAVNASGQVLVSGTSVDQGFPSTPGVYSVANTAFVPYLIELDPTGAKLIFSATGIGGNALAFDSPGNIYMAGTTGSLTYPTTAGSYQPNFPMFQTCLPPCGGQFQGYNQYVTKLDPTGTEMIFSTAVSGNGNTMNEGLAVDAAGNVYLTGIAGMGYPYTVATPPSPSGPALALLAFPALPFLSKLDPLGQKLLYSVPVGGMGVAVDANGNAYVGGLTGVLYPYDITAMLPVLANVAPQCVSAGGTYAAEVDGSGNTLGVQYVGGSIRLSGIALSGSTVWMTGKAGVRTPFSPGALASPNLIPSSAPGAYLGAVNFAAPQPAAGTPQIDCVLDAADFALAGPIVPLQLLTIFGNNLGPAVPVSAMDDATNTLGGVSVDFGSDQATVLYVSSDQINVAVPLISGAATRMEVSVSGPQSAQLEYAVTTANPSVFIVPGTFQSSLQEFVSVALNQDGSMNSQSNPAQLGSVVSIFVNGLATDPRVPFRSAQLSTSLGWSIINVSRAGPLGALLEVQLRTPGPDSNAPLSCPSTSACLETFGIQDSTPYFLPGAIPETAPGPGFSGAIWVVKN